MTFKHITVLLNELVDNLNIENNDIVIDCTAGGGGHSMKMLEACSPEGTVYAIDRDSMAIKNLETKFAKDIEAKRVILVKAPYSSLKEIVEERNLKGKISAIAADIGVSSPQIDLADRGFSFMNDGPLDMRMDSSSGKSAKDVVNTYSETELTKIFREYGEEPKAMFVAQAIVRYREDKPIETTLELANIAKDAIFYKKKSKKHPATKIFQALRIYVNDELGELRKLLNTSIDVLKPKGRLGIISFHSLEDRIVKRTFKSFSDTGIKDLPKGLPFTQEQIDARSNACAKIIKPFPIKPSDEEIKQNPRARSAVLRIIEKI